MEEPDSIYTGFVRRRMQGRCPICRERVTIESIYSEYEIEHERMDVHFKEYILKSIVTHLGESIVEHVRKEHGRKMAYTCTAAGVWNEWSSSTSSYTTVSNATATGDTWSYWTFDAGTTTSSASSVNIVWTDWTEAVVTYSAGDRGYQRSANDHDRNYRECVMGDWQPSRQETDNERSARIAREEQQREENARKAAAQKEKEKKIQDTARDLLREVLTEEQNRQLDKHGYFELKLANGNTYHIYKGRSNNVKRIDQCGRAIESLCFHPSDFLPDYDTMAMQKLMLESNEAEARKSANVTRQ
jgi:uncharacterized Zn finger protein (UPF0148 family)